jgi:tRNA (guanine-N7-)-methyltransferase
MRDNDPVHSEQTPPEQSAPRFPARVVSFQSRRGVLTDAQQLAWDGLWPVLGADVSETPLDAPAWFGRQAPLVLEIGCGTGTATAALAKAEPQLNTLAVEVYRPGIAQLLRQVERDHIPNIRVLRGDAVEVLEKMLPASSLAGVRVFFPDPWPKSRHHKRRLLQPAVFALIADRLAPHGVLHVATDHAEYAEAIREAGDAEPRLGALDWPSPISFERPVTKFEDKAHQVGRPITELIWGKIGS